MRRKPLREGEWRSGYLDYFPGRRRLYDPDDRRLDKDQRGRGRDRRGCPCSDVVRNQRDQNQ